MRLPRMTTRRWMVAVAIVAALFAAFEAGRRWERASGGRLISAVAFPRTSLPKPTEIARPTE